MTPPLKIPAAAAALSVEESWLRRMVTAQKVPFTRLGRQVRFTEAHLAAILAAGEVTPTDGPNRTDAAVIKMRSARRSRAV